MNLMVLTLAQLDPGNIVQLLQRYGLQFHPLPPGVAIAGSYWGETEAGLVSNRVYACPDTPLHSILHETSHYVCMTTQRREGLDTDAGGDDPEECAVCYLQILLADCLPGFGRARMLDDMDRWGYSFRLGSARTWFERDAEDARGWLIGHGLIDGEGTPTWRLRKT